MTKTTRLLLLETFLASSMTSWLLRGITSIVGIDKLDSEFARCSLPSSLALF